MEKILAPYVVAPYFQYYQRDFNSHDDALDGRSQVINSKKKDKDAGNMSILEHKIL
jgi:hypothetical protein